MSHPIATSDVVLACTLPGHGLPDILKTAISEDISWEDFIATARKEALAELVFHFQKETFGHGLVPEFVRDAIKHEHTITLGRNTVFLENLAELEQALAGLDLIVLKGAYLVRSVYATPALRRFSDIDVLVRKADLVEIENRLNETEYRRIGEETSNENGDSERDSLVYRRQDGGPGLHIHWHLIKSDTPAYARVELDIDAIWNAATRDEDGRLQMNPVHRVIHLAEHVLHHSYNRLVLLRDIAEIIDRHGDDFEWNRLSSDSRACQLSLPVFYALSYIHKKGLLNIPENVLESLQQEGLSVVGRLFVRYTLEDRRFPELSNLGYFDMVIGLNQKRRYLASLAFPPTKTLAAIYNTEPEAITKWFYTKRLIRGFYHIARSLLEFIRPNP